MATAEQWRSVAKAIRDCTPARRAPHEAELYHFARRDGIKALSTFSGIDAARRLDLIHDLLATKFKEILDAESPRAFFRTALVRRAISLGRLKEMQSIELVDGHVGSTGAGSENRRAATELMLVVLEELSPRDREALTALGLGDEIPEVARRFGLSQANLYQIKSRARKRLNELFSAEGDELGGGRP